MKRIIVALIVITMAIIAAPVCEAWEVKVTNSCDKQAQVNVWGEHLFWQRIDCETGYLKPGETKTCVMPGAICPVKISGAFWASFASGSEPVETLPQNCYPGGTACCWNLKVRIVQSGSNQCKLQFE